MTDKPMTMKEMQEKHYKSVEEFTKEIQRVCLKPEYSNDVIRDGLDWCINFVRKEIYKARRENINSEKNKKHK